MITFLVMTAYSFYFIKAPDMIFSIHQSRYLLVTEEAELYEVNPIWGLDNSNHF